MASPGGMRVMASAARLQVTTLPDMSVVARPLVRLSTTWRLNAWTSASSLDARCSCASARRRLSARYPVSAATAKKPKLFRPIMNSATRSGGRSWGTTTTGEAGVPKYCVTATPA